jgi:hypothetical protein
MLDYPTDPKLLEVAFQIVADNDFVGHCFHVNGCDFYPGKPQDDALLRLLAQTPARVKIVELRDILNAVLGLPDAKVDEPMTDEKALAEMRAVKEIIDRHVDMGWLATTMSSVMASHTATGMAATKNAPVCMGRTPHECPR